MAVVTGGYGLKVEVQFRNYHQEQEMIEYGFGFFYGSRPVINPEICFDSYFYAGDTSPDSLISTLNRVLERGRSDDWNPHEPHISLEIKPLRKDPDNLTGELPYVFRLTFFIDAYQLKIFPDTPGSGYGGEGPMVQVDVSWKNLAQFIEDLKAEYSAFEARHEIEER